jgi:YD repeat-containing protein
MLASTFMDLVLGVDIHFEMVPMPAPVPTPIPNPFVGMVFDPAGLLVGQVMSLAMAMVSGAPPLGPVLINGFPATTVGTNAINTLGVPHILIPPGTAWAPMPKLPKPSFKGMPPVPGPPVAPEGDAISVFGSQTVNVMGVSAVRMGDKSMSCGEPVRLPSSTVLAIPKGMPVMIGGPPAISIMDAIGALVRSKWVAGYMHDLLSRMKPGRLRNILSKTVCFLTGHPVDVATGRVLTDNVDWQLPGPLPLKLERNYSSAWAGREGPLGFGWSHALDQAVWVERGKIVYLDGEGRELELDVFDFPDHVLPVGHEVFDAPSRLTLKSLGARRYAITTAEGMTYEFAPVAGASGARAAWSRLVRQVARDGRAIALEYDARGNLAWVHDSAGRAIAFEHDRAGGWSRPSCRTRRRKARGRSTRATPTTPPAIWCR